MTVRSFNLPNFGVLQGFKLSKENHFLFSFFTYHYTKSGRFSSKTILVDQYHVDLHFGLMTWEREPFPFLVLHLPLYQIESIFFKDDTGWPVSCRLTFWVHDLRKRTISFSHYLLTIVSGWVEFLQRRYWLTNTLRVSTDRNILESFW